MRKTGFILALTLLLLIIPLNTGCSKRNAERTRYQITCTYSDGVLTGTEKVDFYNFSDNSLGITLSTGNTLALTNFSENLAINSTVSINF